ncbi:MAG: BsuPI-related putative proteinase inhibitor [Bacillota bacterium]
MGKKIIILLLILLISFSNLGSASSLLKINNTQINFNIEPEEIENETLIPIEQFKNMEEFFMQAIGEDKFLIIYETGYYIFSLDSNEVKSDKGNLNICCKPIKINDHVLVPFNLIEIIFGEDISKADENEEKINLKLNLNQEHLDENTTLIVEIEIYNNTNESIKLDFKTSQKYNIIIKNQENEIIYNWEKDKMFTQAFTNNLIESNNSIKFKEEIDISNFRDGKYKLIVELKSTNFQNNKKESMFNIYK